MIICLSQAKICKKGGYQLDFWHEFFAVLVFLRWLHVLHLSWFHGECCCFFGADFQVEANFALWSHAKFLLSKHLAIHDNWIPSDLSSHVPMPFCSPFVDGDSLKACIVKPCCCTCEVQFESFQTGDDWCEKHHSYLTFRCPAMWWFETGGCVDKSEWCS